MTDREKMESRARKFAEDCGEGQAAKVVGDFAESEVLLALRECAKLVCISCAQGLIREQGHFHALGKNRIEACYAARIHARIAELEPKS